MLLPGGIDGSTSSIARQIRPLCSITWVAPALMLLPLSKTRPVLASRGVVQLAPPSVDLRIETNSFPPEVPPPMR